MPTAAELLEARRRAKKQTKMQYPSASPNSGVSVYGGGAFGPAIRYSGVPTERGPLGAVSTVKTKAASTSSKSSGASSLSNEYLKKLDEANAANEARYLEALDLNKIGGQATLDLLNKGYAGLQGVIGGYSTLREEQKKAAEARMAEGKTGYDDLLLLQQSARDEQLGTLDKGYAGVLGELDKTGQAEYEREARRRESEIGRNDASMISRGLAGNTLAETSRRGIVDDSALREQEISERNARLRAGVLESQTTNTANALSALNSQRMGLGSSYWNQRDRQLADAASTDVNLGSTAISAEAGAMQNYYSNMVNQTDALRRERIGLIESKQDVPPDLAAYMNAAMQSGSQGQSVPRTGPAVVNNGLSSIAAPYYRNQQPSTSMSGGYYNQQQPQQQRATPMVAGMPLQQAANMAISAAQQTIGKHPAQMTDQERWRLAQVLTSQSGGNPQMAYQELIQVFGQPKVATNQSASQVYGPPKPENMQQVQPSSQAYGPPKPGTITYDGQTYTPPPSSPGITYNGQTYTNYEPGQAPALPQQPPTSAQVQTNKDLVNRAKVMERLAILQRSGWDLQKQPEYIIAQIMYDTGLSRDEVVWWLQR